MGKETQARCKCCTSKVIVGVLIGIGIILIIPAACFLSIFKHMVEKQLVLKTGSEAYNDWHSPPSPVYMQYYVFNYTNVDAILLSNDTKPNVTQHGPYTYREIRINDVIDYNDYNITYVQNYSYVFDQSLSCPTCFEDDVVFTPSIVACTLINAIHNNVNSTSLLAPLVDIFLKGVHEFSLFKTLTVKQVIWGYTDTLLNLVKELEDILESIGFKLPALNPKISLAQNGTAEIAAIGNITLLTGKENINDVARIIRWRGLDNAPIWLTKYGRMINGTDGSRSSPFVSRDDKLYMFVTDLCRSLYARYQKDEKFMDIDVYHYHTTPELFINHTVNPDNGAFCGPKRCWGSGILPIAECKGGPPIFMSAPHFYQGDPKFIEAIIGMHPNATLHSTTIDIEPNTGLSIQAHKRLQINIMVQKSFLSISTPLQDDFNFLPILFLHEEAIIDAKSAKKLRDQVTTPRYIMVFAQYIMIGVGSALILYAIGLVIILISRRHEKQSYEQFFDDKEAKPNSIDQPS